jgi:hypothetical protein
MDKNCIIFDNYGACDYIFQYRIELSLEKKKGFRKIHPLNLYRKINKLNHIQAIIDIYFVSIVNKIPGLYDENEDIPNEKRFTQLYYKCYEYYSHSHWQYDKKPDITPITLKNLISKVIDENFAIKMPILNKLKI